MKELVLSEVNVKELEFISEESSVLVKKIKANFKALGPKFGKKMKTIAEAISFFTQSDIKRLEKNQSYIISLEGEQIELALDDVLITSQDIPGLLVSNSNGVIVALDISMNNALVEEGIARELVNRIQNIRKDSGFELTDRIQVQILHHKKIEAALASNKSYICGETLADKLDICQAKPNNAVLVEFDEIITYIAIKK
jgi:isoleucyl-tRNA synthetase